MVNFIHLNINAPYPSTCPSQCGLCLFILSAFRTKQFETIKQLLVSGRVRNTSNSSEDFSSITDGYHCNTIALAVEIEHCTCLDLVSEAFDQVCNSSLIFAFP